MVEIPRPFEKSQGMLQAKRKFVICALDETTQDKLRRASRPRTASVILLENGIQVEGVGMDPVFTG